MTKKRTSRPIQRNTGETRRKPIPREAEQIFEVLPDLIFRLDANGIFLDFMGGQKRALFRKPEEFIGKPVGEVLPGEVAEFMVPRIRQVLKSGKPATMDYLLPMPDGPQRFEARLVPTGTGEILALVRNVGGQPAEAVLRDLEERYHGLVELSPSAIAVHDGTTILYVNRAAARLFGGGERDRIVGQPVVNFVHPDSRAAVGRRIAEMLDSHRPMPVAEERFLRTDGTPVDVEVSASSYREGERTLIQVIIRDISQRKADERAIVRLHQLNAFLSAMNRAIVRVADRGELFQRICRIAVEKGGMVAAWVGLLDADGRWLQPTASWGETAGYPEAVRIAKNRGPESKGPTGRALRSGKVAVCNDIAQDPAMEPWREAALARGFRSSAAVPIRSQGEAVGALNLYAPAVQAFGDQEGEVLEALAADLEFALGALDDSRKRQEAEAALAESEQNFRGLFEHSKDGIFVALADGRILSCNSAALRMLGYVPQDVEDLNAGQLYADPADRPVLRGILERDGAVQDYELRFRRKDGAVLDCLISCSLNRGAGGKVLGYQGIVRDVTARRRAEEDLRIKDQAMASALNGFAFMDQQMRVTYVNAAMLRMWGYADPREVLGRKGVEFWADPEKARDSSRAILERGQCQGRLDAKRKDGTVFPVEFSGHLVRDAAGRPLCVMGSFMDITERQQSEEALRESEAQLRALSENLAEGMVYQINSGPDCSKREFTYLSPAVERLHGIPLADAVRDPAFVHRQVIEADRERLMRAEAAALAARTALNVDARFRLPSGDVRWRRFISVPRALANGDWVWDGIELDITDQKRAEDALGESEAQMRALNENLADGMVYQINSGRDGSLRRMVYISSAVERLHGLTVQEVLSDPGRLYDQVVEADRTLLAEREAQAFAAQVPMNCDVQVRLPSGELRWRRFLSTPRTLPNGDIVWDGIEFDITEGKRAALALRESEKKYRTLVESARDAIFLADAETGFIFEVNKQAEKLTGLPAAELIGRHQSLLHPPGERDRYRRIFADHASKSNLMARDLLIRRADGTDVPVDISATTVEVGGRKVVQGVFQDISDRKWAEKALQESLDMLQRSMQGTILAMMTMVEMRDPFTAGHQSRVARLACAIARAMGMNEHQVEGIRVAGLLHDIGKIGVPAEILSKPGRILDFEYNIIKSHSEIGHKILKEIDFPWPIAQMVLHHHERLDGSGYPEGIKGKAILLEARILVVADVVEAMASHRPYRPARGMELALGEVELNKGILYDPEVVDACLALFRDHKFTLD